MRACCARQSAYVSRSRASRKRSLASSALQRTEIGARQNVNSERKDQIKRHTILSGIQPTGVPHLGNYLGALRQWRDFQDASNTSASSVSSQARHRLYYSIVDLHALTGSIAGADRNRLRKESFASLLAVGLSPDHSALFLQSDIPYHTELMWILSTIASTGYLSRMTQWKSKLNLDPNETLFTEAATEKLKLGLFSYPVLQAADILLYKPTLVPVGEDQAQHIEFARTLARGFNAHFGPIPSQPERAQDAPPDETQDGTPSEPQDGPQAESASQKYVFNPIPEALISPAKRVMSLRQPFKKMSKSDPDPRSRILITDTPDDIYLRLKGAVTDSELGITYDPGRRPGVSNLIEILKHATRSDMSYEEIASQHKLSSKQAFKEFVAIAVVKELEGVRAKFLEVMQPGNVELKEAYEKGKRKAMSRAAFTMGEVRKTLGIEPLA